MAKAEAGLTRFSGVAGKIGGALSHAKTAIGGLVSGPLGLIGLTGGLLTAGGAIKSTLDHMNDLAFGTEKLHALTGDSVSSLSTLIAATEKYGIDLDKLTVIAGFYEKNVDAVIASGKAAGVVLTDATGKALPFSEALLNVADAYAQSADKAQAATEAAALFGRGYTAIVPVLELGKQGIIDLEKEAAAMGLQLSEKNIADFAQYRDALRKSQEAVSGLEVAIGEDLLPELTKLASGVSTFISEHKTDIVTFFHNAKEVAVDAAKTIGGFASTIVGFWNTMPPAVRDLMTKGLLADRTVKFLFGFSPIESAASGAFGYFLSRGSSPANPVFVSGGLGGLGGAGEVAGLGLGTLALWGGVGAAIAAAFIFAINQHPDPSSLTPGGSGAGRGASFGAPGGHGRTPLAAAVQAGDDWAQAAHRWTDTINAGDKSFREMHDAVVANTKDYALTAGRDVLLKEIRDASIARYGGTGLGPAAVEATYEHRLLFATERIMDNGQSTDDKIAQLKEIEDTLVSDGDKKTRARIDTLITKLQSQKPPTVNVTIPIRVIQDGYLVSTTTRIVNGTPTTVVSRN